MRFPKLFVVLCVQPLIVETTFKGVAIGSNNLLCDDFNALSGIDYWYDWRCNLNYYYKFDVCATEISNNSNKHVPMIWGFRSYTNYKCHENAQSDILFGPNEPNHKKQSNMTAATVAEMWPTLESNASGKYILSPSAAPCGSHCISNPFQWFDEFFRLCNNCRVDAIATHTYWCGVPWTMKYLRELYERYNKTIWLTEFACRDPDNNATRVLEFMQGILPLLEETPYIAGYDWRCNQNYYYRFDVQLCTTEISNNTNKHIPMIWGFRSYTNYKCHESAQTDILFGPNEPNHKKQSNMTAATVAEMWPTLESNASGKYILSPSAAPCGSHCISNPFQWFDEFFRLCNNCRVDAIATHTYWCGVPWTMKYLRELNERYNKTIWLTEFACRDPDNNATRVLEFMQGILPLLEETPYIAGYFWYMARVPNDNGYIKSSVSLLEPNSSTLTPLGEFFNNF